MHWRLAQSGQEDLIWLNRPRRLASFCPTCLIKTLFNPLNFCDWSAAMGAAKDQFVGLLLPSVPLLCCLPPRGSCLSTSFPSCQSPLYLPFDFLVHGSSKYCAAWLLPLHMAAAATTATCAQLFQMLLLGCCCWAPAAKLSV